MAIPYYHVDAFTSELFAGNPAGVCVLPEFLPDRVMQQIAAENRHAQTAFVVQRGEADLEDEPEQDRRDGEAGDEDAESTEVLVVSQQVD